MKRNEFIRASLGAAVAILVAVAGPVRADAVRDGRNALDANRLDDALTLFTRAANDGSAEGRAGVGQVWLKRHQYAKALDAFLTSQKMDPTLALPVYGQGEVLRLEGHCDQAVPLFRKATEMDRKFPEA